MEAKYPMHSIREQMNEEGGLFGIWNHKKAAEITYYGLHALQHRGQDGAGLVTSNGEVLRLRRDLGLVNDVFKRVQFDKITGQAAIGHVRNANEGEESVEYVQPMLFRSQSGSMALAHNGNVMNAYELRSQLENSGSILQTTAHTEILAHLIKRNSKQVTEESLVSALQQLVGAYACLILTEDKMYVDRKSTRLNS